MGEDEEEEEEKEDEEEKKNIWGFEGREDWNCGPLVCDTV
jgi:hypothetical protein